MLLYRVRVKDGYEETAAMVLANKLLTAGTHFAPLVKAIIGRVSCPRWIFIESDGADASKLCSNVSDYLYEPLVVPKEGDWVRLNCPPLYRGDLVYVRTYKDTSPDRLTTKLKNPGGKVKADNELNFTYLGQRYGDGLHYTVTHKYEPTVPMHKELVLFQRCSFVKPGDIARGINEIAALSLQVTDRIVVTSGELVGMSGIITEFSGNNQEATICLDSTEIAMDVVISPILLRKVIQVSDRVCVVGGPGDSRVGWVVAVDGTELHVWEDKTAMPFKVNVNRVTFHHDVQMYLPVAPKPDVYWKPVEENKYPLYNHNYVYLGRRVMVIRRGVFKGYQGIIREILVDDEVCVELSPTLKNDNKRQPLMYKFQPHTFTAGMPPPAQPGALYTPPPFPPGVRWTPTGLLEFRWTPTPRGASSTPTPLTHPQTATPPPTRPAMSPTTPGTPTTTLERTGTTRSSTDAPATTRSSTDAPATTHDAHAHTATSASQPRHDGAHQRRTTHNARAHTATSEPKTRHDGAHQPTTRTAHRAQPADTTHSPPTLADHLPTDRPHPHTD
ncbi:hypothetical protein DXG01_006525 [Tephrocybe rancida]|nr:hypothetical protein DXG01_006525 [Tephrocybe rancida]